MTTGESESAQMNHHDAVDATGNRSKSRDVRSRTRWLWMGLVVLIAAVAAWPASDWLHRRRQEQYQAACQAALADEDWKELQSASHGWLDWDPTSNEALLFAAEASSQLGESDEAAELLGRVDDDYHGALQALAVRGEILFAELNRPLDAEATWLRMLDINEYADAARKRLTYFYAMTLQRQKMLDQIERAMQLGCESPEAYSYLIMANALNFSDGLALLTRWRQSYPDDETLLAAQAVYAAKQTSNRAMATFGSQVVTPGDQTLLDRCLEKHPSNLEALAVKIDFAIFEGDKDRVAALLQQAPEHAENDSRFWRFRGWLLAAQRRYADAEQSFRHALELLPFDWQSRWLLADVLRKLNRTAEADDVARLALEGKELQQELFERPNARDLDEALIRKIHAYLQQLDAPVALAALERRL